MKKVLFFLPLIAALAACETTSDSTAVGALAGAAIGASVSGSDDKVQGALIGAALGGAAGNYIGKTQNGDCVYQRADGSRYLAACP